MTGAQHPLRPELPPLPARMQRLPVDKRGYPVPAFVSVVNGEPDHRLANPAYLAHAVKLGKCWLCGEPLGSFRSFVVGPIAAMNKISNEPPSHHDCAEFAVRGCPFLSRPKMRRREAGMPPEDLRNTPPGVMLLGNPGVMCVWTTRGYRVHRGKHAGALFQLDEPTSLSFWSEGRLANHGETLLAFLESIPAVREIARAEGSLESLRVHAVAFLARLEKHFGVSPTRDELAAILNERGAV